MEFKCKAWDKKLKRIFEVSQLDFSDWWLQCKRPLDAPEENGGAYYGERNSFRNEETDRHIILPYTGVKDVNKKESYLGDILKEPKLTYEYEPNKDHEKAFYIVKKELHNNNMYLEYNFNIRGYWEKNDLQLCRIEGLEIVGNIYENQEMIKKK